MTKPDCAQRE